MPDSRQASFDACTSHNEQLSADPQLLPPPVIDELCDIASVSGINVEPEHEIILANMLPHHLHTHTAE